MDCEQQYEFLAIRLLHNGVAKFCRPLRIINQSVSGAAYMHCATSLTSRTAPAGTSSIYLAPDTSTLRVSAVYNCILNLNVFLHLW
jgi:hypothetical protein